MSDIRDYNRCKSLEIGRWNCTINRAYHKVVGEKSGNAETTCIRLQCEQITKRKAEHRGSRYSYTNRESDNNRGCGTLSSRKAPTFHIAIVQTNFQLRAVKTARERLEMCQGGIVQHVCAYRGRCTFVIAQCSTSFPIYSFLLVEVSSWRNFMETSKTINDFLISFWLVVKLVLLLLLLQGLHWKYCVTI